MANKFAGTEIVEIGVQIEINGRDFYSALSKRTKNKNAKELFKFLADEEEKHISDFRNIIYSVEKYEPKETYTEEYFAYMNSLASGYVFAKKDKGKKIAKTIKDENEALAIGIKAEEDSITFYTAMKKIIPESDQAIIERVIGEEKSHLEKLRGLKKRG